MLKACRAGSAKPLGPRRNAGSTMPLLRSLSNLPGTVARYKHDAPLELVRNRRHSASFQLAPACRKSLKGLRVAHWAFGLPPQRVDD